MSICHCLISGSEKEDEKIVKGINIGIIKKAFKYQL